EAREMLQPGEDYTVNNIAITLAADGVSAVITGADIAAYTNLDEVLTTAFNGESNQSYYTAVSFDEGALATRLDQINATLSTAPTDASVSYVIGEDGKPDFTYTEGTPGYGIDVEAARTLVLEALNQGQYQTTISPPLTTLAPAVTVEDAKAHMSLIVSYNTT
ncbi:MAG: peptidoglycan binding domain-containing protein, partial [Clostridia bacterium]|nr:peptidoglycan binding domain-containing protein [Clostridia bacterium]